MYHNTSNTNTNTNHGFFVWGIFVYPFAVIIAAYILNPSNPLAQIMQWVNAFMSWVK